MATTEDLWYVRLPDGRVIRTRSTVSLRYHVRKGRIPVGSRVRRPSGATWHALGEVAELAEAAATAQARSHLDHSGKTATIQKARLRSRADFQDWRLTGLRGLVRELLDALDSSLHRAKLGVACFLGLLGGIGWIAWDLLAKTLDEEWWIAGATALAVLLLVASCTGIAWITQFTSIELSRLRPPRRGELWPSVMRHAIRLALALLLVVGAGVALVALFRWLPQWMLQRAVEEPWWEYAAGAALSLRLILEVIFWPVIALAPLLLGPTLIVQDASVLRSIGEWWRMLRRHLGRIFLYEALATTLAAVFTVPLLVPIALASWSLRSMEGLQLIVGQATLTVLTGIALTPLIAYLLVANVFIYLNLRYEFFHSARR